MPKDVFLKKKKKKKKKYQGPLYKQKEESDELKNAVDAWDMKITISEKKEKKKSLNLTRLTTAGSIIVT